MHQNQKCNLPTEDIEIIHFKSSIEAILNFIMEQCGISYAFASLEFENHSIQITLGDYNFDLISDYLKPHHKTNHKNGISTNVESIKIDSLPSFFILSSIPLQSIEKNYNGVVHFLVNENQALTQEKIKLIEFGKLQIETLATLFYQNNALYKIIQSQEEKFDLFSEDTLKKNNERFIYASEATSDALWDWNIISNEIFVGESYSLLFGYHFENNILPGPFCEGLVHPDDKQDYEDSIDVAIENGNAKWAHEYRYLKACGTYAYVSDKAIIIRDDRGEAIRMIGAMQDITQEKLLKDELLQSEERFKGAFNHSSLGMALVNYEDKWIEVNDRMCEILGYTREEFKNITYFDITYKEDLAADLAYEKQMQNGEISSFNMKKRYIHKNKSLVWVHLSVSAVKNSLGEIQHYVAQIIDISERKRMEEENRLLIEEKNRNKALQLIEAKNWYRLLADNTIDLVCLHNLDATFKYVSPSIQTLLGYDPEELIGKYPEDYVHPEDLKKFKKRIGSIIKDKELFSEQVRLRNSEGEYIWFETNASLVYENKIPVSFQSSTRDITQRKKAEQIIEDTLLQERQLNELRTNLVSTISHEFRTPMTTIRTSAELITMYLQNSQFNEAPQIEKRVKTITAEIDRIVELMDAVLTISKDDAGKTSYNPIVCNLNEICKEVIETSFNNQKDNRNVDVLFKSNKVEIFADINLIKYTLFNVLSNAFKYSEGCGNVQLNLFIVDNFVQIDVIDNGIGIPKEEQSKLFNTFYRASNSNGIQGTGLGLYIIKMFTKKNSGRVYLESELGKGTKVTLRFPLYKN
jgi:PAS domain S-box-containing protein